jgi:inner membrane protein
LLIGLIVWYLGFREELNPLILSLGCLLPDSDHRSTLIGKVLPLWLFFSHRGFTHTVWGLLIFVVATGYLTSRWDWALALGVGYLTHLVSDSFTPSGIRLFGRR